MGKIGNKRSGIKNGAIGMAILV